MFCEVTQSGFESHLFLCLSDVFSLGVSPKPYIPYVTDPEQVRSIIKYLDSLHMSYKSNDSSIISLLDWN